MTPVVWLLELKMHRWYDCILTLFGVCCIHFILLLMFTLFYRATQLTIIFTICILCFCLNNRFTLHCILCLWWAHLGIILRLVFSIWGLSSIYFYFLSGLLVGAMNFVFIITDDVHDIGILKRAVASGTHRKFLRNQTRSLASPRSLCHFRIPLLCILIVAPSQPIWRRFLHYVSWVGAGDHATSILALVALRAPQHLGMRGRPSRVSQPCFQDEGLVYG